MQINQNTTQNTTKFYQYTDVCYRGSYEHPITISKDPNPKKFNMSRIDKITITGEGGNRVIIVSVKDGSYEINVDTHTFDSRFCFCGFPRIRSGRPDAYVLLDILNVFLHNSRWDGVFFNCTKYQINSIFRELYRMCIG